MVYSDDQQQIQNQADLLLPQKVKQDFDFSEAGMC
jgi:hypothetical protein